jgi:anti-sigma factor RsiW
VKCRELIKELDNYLEVDLDPALRAEIEHHLDRCGECRLVVDTTRKTVQIFCNAQPIPLPEDVRHRLHDVIRKHCGKRDA